ncbi:MAG TPA: hypothetical protein VN888_05990, partial [Mycobacterium sp.]|nr:hypothetical protein [Mycobacterium sp.]
ALSDLKFSCRVAPLTTLVSPGEQIRLGELGGAVVVAPVHGLAENFAPFSAATGRRDRSRRS